MADEQKEVIVPEKFQDIVSKLEKLTVLEMAELVKVLEDKFGVSAAPQVVAGAAPAAAEAGAGDQAKSTVSVMLKEGGESKIQVIKAIREITGLGLQEAKAIVDAAPKAVKENIAVAEAEDIKKKLEEAGATVELK
ncbi:MAG TPA: 50S ribosomal protein L7/L12 [Candidatus Paceibacterota bacterium]|nr:50S ribosomal protein L7/L12 [Candidatus Paceibacterota bacterium]